MVGSARQRRGKAAGRGRDRVLLVPCLPTSPSSPILITCLPLVIYSASELMLLRLMSSSSSSSSCLTVDVSGFELAFFYQLSCRMWLTAKFSILFCIFSMLLVLRPKWPSSTTGLSIGRDLDLWVSKLQFSCCSLRFFRSQQNCHFSPPSLIPITEVGVDSDTAPIISRCYRGWGN
jgi:hypothetical protein